MQTDKIPKKDLEDLYRVASFQFTQLKIPIIHYHPHVPLYIIVILHIIVGTFLVVQTVKNLPAIQETWVNSLGWEDPLEKGMATHSSILAWRIPWTEEPGGP